MLRLMNFDYEFYEMMRASQDPLDAAALFAFQPNYNDISISIHNQTNSEPSSVPETNMILIFKHEEKKRHGQSMKTATSILTSWGL